MTFNGADKSNSIIAHIDFLLFGTSASLNTSYSLTDRTRNVNITYDELVPEFFKADPTFKWDDSNHTDFPIATLALTANQTHYTIPDSALVVHRVRIKGSNGEYVTLEPVLRSELSDNELKATGTPNKYFKLGNAIFPVPIPDYGAADGVELEFQRAGHHFETTDEEQTPGFASQFHHYLAVGAAIQYAIANGLEKKAAQLRAEKTQLLTQIQDHYAGRSPDDRTRIALKRPGVRRYGL